MIPRVLETQQDGAVLLRPVHNLQKSTVSTSALDCHSHLREDAAGATHPKPHAGTQSSGSESVDARHMGHNSSIGGVVAGHLDRFDFAREGWDSGVGNATRARKVSDPGKRSCRNRN